MTDLLETYKTLKTWDDKIEFIGRVKRRVGRNRDLMKLFVEDVCEFNSRQKTSGPIRSMSTGKFLKNGSRQYIQTLKKCKIVHHHVSCDDIIKKENLVDPVSGRRLKRPNKNTRKFIKRCSIKTK